MILGRILPTLSACMLGCLLASAAAAHNGPHGPAPVVVIPAPYVVVRPAARIVPHRCGIYGCVGVAPVMVPYAHVFPGGVCTHGTCTVSRTVTTPSGGTATVSRSLSN